MIYGTWLRAFICSPLLVLGAILESCYVSLDYCGLRYMQEKFHISLDLHMKLRHFHLLRIVSIVRYSSIERPLMYMYLGL